MARRTAAMVGGVAFAVPWLSRLISVVGGTSSAGLLLWHPLHAVAGTGFALALLGDGLRTRGSVTAGIGAVAFAIANAGEALTGNEAFVPLYGLGIVVISIGMLMMAMQKLDDAPTVLLGALGLYPLTFALQAVGSDAARIAGDVLGVAYGIGWIALAVDRRRPIGA